MGNIGEFDEDDLVAFEEVLPGDLWIYGPWDSSVEATPWE